MQPPRPAPITAAGVLLLFLGGEALVVAAVSAGLAWWWVTPAHLRGFLSFLGLAVFLLYLAVEFVRFGVKLLLGTLDSPDKLREHLKHLALPGLLMSGLATFLAVMMFVKPSPTRPVEKEIAMVAGAVTAWANLAVMVVVRRLLGRHWSRYDEWRLAKSQSSADVEEPE